MQFEPFDPRDPFNREANRIRQKVADIALRAGKRPDFRALPADRQVECIAAGMVTGLIGVLFAHVTPGGRDAMMEFLAAYMEQARLNVEGIIDGPHGNA